jgi:hypothetical protein
MAGAATILVVGGSGAGDITEAATAMPAGDRSGAVGLGGDGT